MRLQIGVCGMKIVIKKSIQYALCLGLVLSFASKQSAFAQASASSLPALIELDQSNVTVTISRYSPSSGFILPIHQTLSNIGTAQSIISGTLTFHEYGSGAGGFLTTIDENGTTIYRHPLSISDDMIDGFDGYSSSAIITRRRLIPINSTEIVAVNVVTGSQTQLGSIPPIFQPLAYDGTGVVLAAQYTYRGSEFFLFDLNATSSTAVSLGELPQHHDIASLSVPEAGRFAVVVEDSLTGAKGIMEISTGTQLSFVSYPFSGPSSVYSGAARVGGFYAGLDSSIGYASLVNVVNYLTGFSINIPLPLANPQRVTKEIVWF